MAPALLYILELYKVDVVKALDVRKEDLRLKFGEAFEDLMASSPTEKFSDIGNYEATKKELHDAIISPDRGEGGIACLQYQSDKGTPAFRPPWNR